MKACHQKLNRLIHHWCLYGNWCVAFQWQDNCMLMGGESTLHIDYGDCFDINTSYAFDINTSYASAPIHRFGNLWTKQIELLLKEVCTWDIANIGRLGVPYLEYDNIMKQFGRFKVLLTPQNGYLYGSICTYMYRQTIQTYSSVSLCTVMFQLFMFQPFPLSVIDIPSHQNMVHDDSASNTQTVENWGHL